jgi:purine-binding chemotaxis protein CheW
MNMTAASAEQEYLTFTLGQEHYGVDILKVQEIRGWEPLREMHDVPPYIKGVLDFRGRIIPIVDLRIRFAVEPVEYLPTTVVIVLSRGDGDMMGVVVDAVSDVLSIRGDAIKPPPRLGSHINNEYVTGMVSLEQGMVMLIDAERLIDPDELEAAQRQAG